MPARPARPWIAIYAATAVMMVISLGVLFWQASQSRHDAGARIVARPSEIPAERYQLLSRFEPPSYNGQFHAAMEHYTKRDYAGAIPGLRAADFPEARFYLGICLLLTNDRAAGVKELQAVIASGETPYLEQARFYLAKGLLGGGDIGGAQRQLENVLAMHGDLEKQTRALLAQIK